MGNLNLCNGLHTNLPKPHSRRRPDLYYISDMFLPFAWRGHDLSPPRLFIIKAPWKDILEQRAVSASTCKTCRNLRDGRTAGYLVNFYMQGKSVLNFLQELPFLSSGICLGVQEWGGRQVGQSWCLHCSYRDDPEPLTLPVFPEGYSHVCGVGGSAK